MNDSSQQLFTILLFERSTDPVYTNGSLMEAIGEDLEGLGRCLYDFRERGFIEYSITLTHTFIKILEMER